MIVKCAYCGKELKRKPSRVNNFKGSYCNQQHRGLFFRGKPTWNKGLKNVYTLSEQHKINIGLGVQKNPKIKETQFKKGYKWNEKSKKKRIQTIKKTGALSGERNGMFGRNGNKNPNWQGGISYWRKKYYNSITYKNWQKEVFRRDNYKCQICGDTKKSNKIIHAHHIKSFAKYPKLRLDIDNGITLCNICHSKVHSKDFQLGKIIDIQIEKEKIDMIDIEVKDNNNFFANGILVHNSASPYREDGRHSYIFALTGFPIGLNWQDLMKLLGKKYHDINVYIFDTMEQKIRFATNLVAKDTKTLLFVDKIEIGERLANILGVPFIHGATKNRIEIAKESKVFIASRVMELGISIKDLEHIIEVDFLFGSKREEIQRTGRLFHSKSKETKKHDILMTREEFEAYGKRLHGLVEKGFKINLRPMVTGSFQIKKQEIAKVKGKLVSSTTGKVYKQIISDLVDEGFFRIPVTAKDVRERVAKRGIILSARIIANINNELRHIVERKRLAKFKQGGKSVYQER